MTSKTTGVEDKTKPIQFKRLCTFPLIRHNEMTEPMCDATVKIVSESCDLFVDNNQNAAQMIKETLDERYGGSWHVVVGEQFGLEVSHEAGTLLYLFYGGDKAVCVWRCV